MPLKALVNDLGPSLLKLNGDFEINPATNKTLTRINRDMRFARNLPPYKDHMLALFYREGCKKKDAQLFIGIQPKTVWTGLYVGPHLLEDKSPVAKLIAKRKNRIVEIGKNAGVGKKFKLGVCQRYGQVDNFLSGNKAEHYLAGPHLVVLREEKPADIVKRGDKLVDQMAKMVKDLYPLWAAYSGA